MRVMIPSLLAGAALLLVLPCSAQAQYFYEGPQKPEVEIDLSVLNDPSHAPTPTPPANNNYGGFPPPITSAVPPTPVERAPLPPIASPYESSRVVDRIELEGANPYIGRPAPSPFSPPAVIKPPKPAPEAPRTTPARVFKPTAPTAMDGGAPVIVEAEPEIMHEDGVEMPAINVTNHVRDLAPRTAPVADSKKKTARIQKPARKPAVLTLASEQKDSTQPVANVRTTASVAPPELSPIAQNITETAPPPEVKKSAETVIDDLYTLPPREEAPAPNVETAAIAPADNTLPLSDDTAPPLLAPPVTTNTDTVTGSVTFAATTVSLDQNMHREIDRIADLLDDSDTSRLLIKGYASGTDTDRASARRLSVSRALAVRAYLMDKGIKPSRVDVRGMGNESETAQTAADRVDLVLIP